MYKRRQAKGLRRHKRPRKYRLWELISLSILSVLFASGCVWLFFQQLWLSMLVAILLSPALVWKVRNMLGHRFDKKVEQAFCNILVVISGSLAAGSRLERCIGEISENSAPEYDFLRPEFQRMDQLIRLNWPVERVFEEFATRFESPDIRVFSTALSAGIPAGVNLVELVRRISAAIRMKCDTEAEIERLLNLPKYNNRIILLMPFVSVFVIRMMAPSYAAVLDTGIGRAIMLLASLLLAVALILGDLLGKVRY